MGAIHPLPYYCRHWRPSVPTEVEMRFFARKNILSLFVTSALSWIALDGAAVAQDGDAGNSLVVHVANVAPQGIVRLGLYTRATYPDDNATPVASADVSATGGETVVILRNVPAGIYAIEVYQDLNSNGRMDSNFLGLPKEPYGFSRDARPLLSKPDFARVKFDLAAGQNSQSLHLQNLQTPNAVFASN